MSRRTLAILAVLGVVVALGTEWFDIRRGGIFLAIGLMELAIGLAYIGAGLVAWRRRPDNRVGKLMTALGVAWFIGAASVLPLVEPPGTGIPHWDAYRIILGFDALGQAILVHLLLAYPTGRLASRPSRVVAVIAYANVLVLGFGRVLFIDFFAFGENAYYHYHGFQGYLALFPNRDVAVTLQRLYEGIWVGVLVAVTVVIAHRWYVSTHAARRSLAALWFAGVVVAMSISMAAPTVVGGYAPSQGFADEQQEGVCCTGGIETTSLTPTPYFQIPDTAREVLFWVVRVGQLLVPIAFLFGLLRMRLARIGVSRLVLELGEAPPPDRLRDALARTLGDPSLRVAYWMPSADGYVDERGQAFELPPDGSGQTVTVLERDGDPVAALVHDPALADQPELVLSAGAAASLALENERLHAEVRAQLEEVRASRARIVEAADAERRRLERDIHDGAQQRLVTASLALTQARAQSDGEPAVTTSLEQAAGELKLALAELRELARGIHPAILTQEGLEPAIQSLADRSAVRTVVESAPAARFAPQVEATAYFVVSEALANVAKHAGAGLATVALAERDGCLHVEVRDDGVGDARMVNGSGLSGLADRVAALGGHLTVSSPRGRGTTVEAEIPCG